MGIAFLLEAAAVLTMILFRDNPLLFVLLSGVVFFGWGEIFSLFPSTLTDTFGTKHATTNYGFLYMAQGVGSVLGGPLAALLFAQTGSWLPVFAIIIAMDALTATAGAVRAQADAEELRRLLMHATGPALSQPGRRGRHRAPDRSASTVSPASAVCPTATIGAVPSGR